MIKTIYPYFLIVAMLMAPLLSSDQKPNLLVIISDDQGYGDFGFTGNELVDTPNLDRLSKQSAFYPHCMVAPACTPTRSALLTGRDHLKCGVWGVGPRGDVRRDETLMPSFFKRFGYQSWLFGKWDGAKAMELGPVERGFDWFCGIGGGYLQKRPMLCTPEKAKWTEGWSAELITDAAIERIKASKNTPWLAYMAYIIPHLPWECPDSYAEPYRKKGYSESFSQCYGSIKQMDDQIGRLLSTIKEMGQDENTIVVFLSDNGPTENKPAWVNDNYKHAQDSKDWKLRNPQGLIGHKAEVWDHGIRSPLLIKWSGQIAPGQRKEVAKVEDLLPTLLDLCELPKNLRPTHRSFDGQSLRDSLEDPSYQSNRDIFRLALAGPGEPGTATSSGIFREASEVDYNRLHTVLRHQNYKFHHLPGDKQLLFDIDQDPGEKNDLSHMKPELTQNLSKRCRGEWREIVKTNRTFQMRQIVIDPRKRKSWKISANKAIDCAGDMKFIFYGGALGFVKPGDRADYTIEVEQPVEATFSIKGKGLDDCAEVDLMLNGQIIKADHRSASRIDYSSLSLAAGKQRLSLLVQGDQKPGQKKAEVVSIDIRSI